VVTILLLVASNLFMTFAWYGHLKFKSWPLWLAVLASWGIAFFEYCLQVPANRWGHGRFCAAQLKIMQEVITIVVFTAFAFLYLGESPRWNYLVAYALIVTAVGFAFLPTSHPSSDQVDLPPPLQRRDEPS
jgi:uncharacterized protein (DUF486 family)